MTDEPTLLGGRYQLGGLLGRGGMAEVHRARDLRLGRDVAVKQLRIDLATDPTFQARFRREAQAAAGLNHPNIVAVYDTGEEADPSTGVHVPYIVMELVEGHTLRELLRTGRQIQPEKALQFAMGVLDALNYSHKAGIVHRDIKPANVMLTSAGVVKVMDFGIARAVADTSATMTQTAAVIGTAQYLSPEQARGETVDSRSDIYSAGCLLYELLVGRPPFQGDSPVSVAYQHVREQPVPPSSLDPMVTPGMDAIVLKSLAKDPADRYQTAAAMRADIGRLLAGQDVTARAPRMPAAVPVSAAAATVLVPPASAAAGVPTTVLPTESTLTQTGATRAIEPAKQRRSLAWLWATLAALAVIGAVIGAWFYFFPPAPPVQLVTVPTLVDRKLPEASETLQGLGLKILPEEEEGPDDASVGRIIKQDPLPGEEVEPGTTVNVVINVGPKKATIPSGIKGMNYEDATRLLAEAGFTNVRTEVDPNEPLTAKENEVTTINPVEGASVPLNQEIVIGYATGESPVPNLRAMTPDEAEKAARQAGFNSITFKTEETAAEVEGLVFKQSPGPGELVKRTKKITLTVAKAPPPPPTTPPPTTPPPTTPPPPESTPPATPGEGG